MAFTPKLLQQGAAGGKSKDAQFNYVTMLLHGDGTNGAQNNTFLDGSTNNFTITRSGNTSQGSFSPYGPNWSNYFDGTVNAGYLDISGSNVFETNSFCFEAWIYPTNASAQQMIMATSGNGGFFVGMNVNAANKLGIGRTFVAVENEVTYNWVSNQWYHIAVNRSGTSLQFFVNGTQVGATGSNSVNYTVTGRRIGAETSGGSPFSGYISNLRCVNTSVYTSNFTPSTTPLAVFSGAAPISTSLLTCQSNRFVDNSVNGYTITPTAVSVQRFNPFGASTDYSTSVIGGSSYYDGDDSLSLPNNAALKFGTSDFTIEFWFYYTGGEDITGTFTGGTSSRCYEITQNGGEIRVRLASIDGYFWNYGSAGTARLNTWNHFALTRSGTTFRTFLNGGAGQTLTSSSEMRDYTGGIQIGRSQYFYAGYISDYRILIGTALYTSAFTPPTAPLTAITNTRFLCNFTNSAIFDNAMMNDLETVGNAQISTSVKKYGTGSLAFDGTGDYLAAPQTVNTDFGTGDFTVEFWANWASASSSSTLVCKWGLGSSNQYAWLINYNTSGNLWFYTGDSGSPGSLFTFGFTPTTSTWYHIAFTRSGSSLKCFVNGTQAGSTETTTQNMSAVQGTFVGNNPNSNTYFNGYIDDLRITKGYARYTANFTAPTASFKDTGPI